MPVTTSLPSSILKDNAFIARENTSRALENAREALLVRLYSHCSEAKAFNQQYAALVSELEARCRALGVFNDDVAQVLKSHLEHIVEPKHYANVSPDFYAQLKKNFEIIVTQLNNEALSKNYRAEVLSYLISNLRSHAENSKARLLAESVQQAQKYLARPEMPFLYSLYGEKFPYYGPVEDDPKKRKLPGTLNSWDNFTSDQLSYLTKFNQQYEAVIQKLKEHCSALGINSGSLNSHQRDFCGRRYFVDQPPEYYVAIKENMELIVFCLQSEKLPSVAKVKLLSDLLEGINVCGPGVYEKIQNIRERLMQEETVINWLAGLRTTLIRQYAEKHFEAKKEKIREGSAIHVHTVFMQYAQTLGWNPSSDQSALNEFHAKLAAVEAADQEKFQRDFLDRYTPLVIIDEIAMRFNDLIFEKTKKLRDSAGRIDACKAAELEEALSDLDLDFNSMPWKGLFELNEIDGAAYYCMRALPELRAVLVRYYAEVAPKVDQKQSHVAEPETIGSAANADNSANASSVFFTTEQKIAWERKFSIETREYNREAKKFELKSREVTEQWLCYVVPGYPELCSIYNVSSKELYSLTEMLSQSKRWTDALELSQLTEQQKKQLEENFLINLLPARSLPGAERTLSWTYQGATLAVIAAQRRYPSFIEQAVSRCPVTSGEASFYQYDVALCLADMNHDAAICRILAKASKNTQTLLLAAKAGQNQLVAHLAKNATAEAINATEPDGMKAFHYVAMQGDLQAAQALLDKTDQPWASVEGKKASPEEKASPYYGFSAIEIAAQRGHWSFVKDYLKVSFSRVIRGRIFYYAVRDERYDMVDLLAAETTDPISISDKVNAARLVMGKSFEQFKAFYEKIIASDTANKANFLPTILQALFTFIRENEQNAIDYLVEKQGPNILNTSDPSDKSGKTALHVMVEENRLDFIKNFLPQLSYDTTETLYITIKSLIESAAQKKRWDIFLHLFESCQYYLYYNDYNFVTKLSFMAIEAGEISVTKAIFDAGMRWNSCKDGQGSQSGLEAAAALETPAIFDDIYRRIPQAEKDKDAQLLGKVALVFAQKGAADKVMQLLRDGASQTINIHGSYLLHFAAKMGHIELITLLLAGDSNQLGSSNQQNETPLSIAVKAGQWEAARLIAEKLVQMRIRDASVGNLIVTALRGGATDDQMVAMAEMCTKLSDLEKNNSLSSIALELLQSKKYNAATVLLRVLECKPSEQALIYKRTGQYGYASLLRLLAPHLRDAVRAKNYELIHAMLACDPPVAVLFEAADDAVEQKNETAIEIAFKNRDWDLVVRMFSFASPKFPINDVRSIGYIVQEVNLNRLAMFVLNALAQLPIADTKRDTLQNIFNTLMQLIKIQNNCCNDILLKAASLQLAELVSRIHREYSINRIDLFNQIPTMVNTDMPCLRMLLEKGVLNIVDVLRDLLSNGKLAEAKTVIIACPDMAIDPSKATWKEYLHCVALQGDFELFQLLFPDNGKSADQVKCLLTKLDVDRLSKKRMLEVVIERLRKDSNNEELWRCIDHLLARFNEGIAHYSMAADERLDVSSILARVFSEALNASQPDVAKRIIASGRLSTLQIKNAMSLMTSKAYWGCVAEAAKCIPKEQTSESEHVFNFTEALRHFVRQPQNPQNTQAMQALISAGADLTSSRYGLAAIAIARELRNGSFFVALAMSSEVAVHSATCANDFTEALWHFVLQPQNPQNTQAMQALISAGADLTSPRDGSAIVIAREVRNGSFFVALAMSSVAPAHRATCVNDFTQALFAYLAQTPSDLNAIKSLVKEGADLAATNTDGLTPLAIAIKQNNWPLIIILVEQLLAANPDTNPYQALVFEAYRQPEYAAATDLARLMPGAQEDGKTITQIIVEDNDWQALGELASMLLKTDAEHGALAEALLTAKKEKKEAVDVAADLLRIADANIAEEKISKNCSPVLHDLLQTFTKKLITDRSFALTQLTSALTGPIAWNYIKYLASINRELSSSHENTLYRTALEQAVMAKKEDVALEILRILNFNLSTYGENGYDLLHSIDGIVLRTFLDKIKNYDLETRKGFLLAKNATGELAIEVAAQQKNWRKVIALVLALVEALVHMRDRHNRLVPALGRVCFEILAAIQRPPVAGSSYYTPKAALQAVMGGINRGDIIDILYLKNSDGKTLFQVAAESGKFDMLYHLRSGDLITLDLARTGYDAVVLAVAQANNARIMSLQALDRAGEVASMRDQNGCTPLHWAVTHNNIEIAQRLNIRTDAEIPNAAGFTPIGLAVAGNKKEILAMMLAKTPENCLQDLGKYQEVYRFMNAFLNLPANFSSVTCQLPTLNGDSYDFALSYLKYFSKYRSLDGVDRKKLDQLSFILTTWKELKDPDSQTQRTKITAIAMEFTNNQLSDPALHWQKVEDTLNRLFNIIKYSRCPAEEKFELLGKIRRQALNALLEKVENSLRYKPDTDRQACANLLGKFSAASIFNVHRNGDSFWRPSKTKAQQLLEKLAKKETLKLADVVDAKHKYK